MELPAELKDRIRDGDVILFLGSGASYGATSRDGSKTAPLGNRLAALLAKKFLPDEDHEGASLTFVSQTIEAVASVNDMQVFIADYMSALEPADYHYLIPEFRWRLIAGTNYDTVIEQVYITGKGKRLQNVQPWVRDSDAIDDFRRDPQSLLYLKLHGCINHIQDPRTPLVLMTEQFNSVRDGRNNMFNHLVEIAYEKPIVYAGFSMSDQDVLQIEALLNQELGESRPPHYVVLPGLTPARRQFFVSKGFQVLSGGFEDFLRAADQAIPKHTRVLSGIIQSTHPIERHLTKHMAELPLLTALVTNEYEYVYSDMPLPEEDPKSFYHGVCRNFRPIQQGWYVKRSAAQKLVDSMRSSEAQRCENYVVLGAGGAGKSVLLRHFAWELAGEGKLVLYLRELGRINIAGLQQLWSAIDERLYIFVDDVTTHSAELEVLMRAARSDSKAQVTVVTNARLNDWETQCERLHGLVEEAHRFELKRLTDNEVRELLRLLGLHRALGTLERMSEQERLTAFQKHAERHLLVALYSATNARPFEDIILDEYQRITPPQAQLLYRAVALLNRFKVNVRAPLIRRVFGISYNDFKERFFAPLQGLVFGLTDEASGDFYRTRHSEIARVLIAKLYLHPEDLMDEMLKIIGGFNLSYDSDRVAFDLLINHRNVLEHFGNDTVLVEKLYEVAMSKGDQATVLRQWGSFEFRRGGADFYLAESLLLESLRLRHDNFTLHALAELNLAWAADRAIDRNEREFRLNEASQALAPLLQNPHHKSVALHTLGKIEFLRLRKAKRDDFNEDAFHDAKQRLQRVFDRATREFPREPRFFSLRSDVSRFLDEPTEALHDLERAYHLDRSQVHTVRKLVLAYDAVGRSSDADRILNEALEREPEHRDLNWLRFLRNRQTLTTDAALSLLQRVVLIEASATSEQKFWLARYMHQYGVLHEQERSKQMFIDLSIRFRNKEEVIDYAKQNGELITFQGVVKSFAKDAVFITRDLTGENLFAPRSLSESANFEMLRPGQRVSFTLGYRYRGPVVCSIEGL